MKMPPNSVTAHNGMDSKNPTFSTAPMISCGMIVSDVPFWARENICKHTS